MLTAVSLPVDPASDFVLWLIIAIGLKALPLGDMAIKA